ncbi:MAG: hypothetical protein WD097_08165 [Balneolales bacterium]
MTLKIVDTTVPDKDEWADTWHQCRWATFFESPEWCYCWEEAYADTYRADPIMFTFSDGVKAIIPGTTGKRLLGSIRIRESSPGGTYGGPISSSNLKPEHLKLLTQKFISLVPNGFFRVNPYLLREVNISISGDKDFTQTVFLNQKEEKLASQLKKKGVLKDAAKARSEGFNVRITNETDLKPFMKIYFNARQRWQKVTKMHSPAFYSCLIGCDHVDFWGCYNKEHQLVGGRIVGLGNHNVVSWQAVKDTDYMMHRLGELYHADLFWYYRNRGFTWFDLSPSGGHRGVEQFKDKFLPYRLPSPVVSQRSLLTNFINFIRSAGKRNG